MGGENRPLRAPIGVGDNSRRATDSSHGADHLIAKIAGRQHGNITHTQLRACGLTDQAIRYRVAVGRLYKVHHGVYAVGRPPITSLERAAAAVLACGPGAALSHQSALAIWGLRAHWPASCDVTIRGDRRPSAITVHRTRTLARRDLTVQRAIRVTSPARTLLDCAPALSDRGLTRAVNDARLARLCGPDALADVVARNRNHPGAKRLARLAQDANGPTRSEFEDRFAGLCGRYNLPTPAFNVSVAGYEVDAYFEAARLIVELDSWEFHQDRGAFERDRDRDADHLAAGLRTARITWGRLVKTPGREARRLQAILRR
jgi:predicted transcriptional regulator of viral defense system